MKKIIFVFLFCIPTLSFSSLLGHDDDLTAWIGYDQKLGVLNDKFITYGGATAGISIYGLSVGAGVYGNYLYNDLIPSAPFTTRTTIIYGGLVLGYKSPEIELIRFRINTLLGYGTIQINENTTGHFVVSPTLYIDFEVYEDINVSVGLNYRYFHNVRDDIGINKAENSLSAVIAVSWIGD